MTQLSYNNASSSKMHYSQTWKNIAKDKVISSTIWLNINCFRRTHVNDKTSDECANSNKGIFLINVMVSFLVKISHGFPIEYLPLHNLHTPFQAPKRIHNKLTVKFIHSSSLCQAFHLYITAKRLLVLLIYTGELNTAIFPYILQTGIQF